MEQPASARPASHARAANARSAVAGRRPKKRAIDGIPGHPRLRTRYQARTIPATSISDAPHHTGVAQEFVGTTVPGAPDAQVHPSTGCVHIGRPQASGVARREVRKTLLISSSPVRLSGPRPLRNLRLGGPVRNRGFPARPPRRMLRHSRRVLASERIACTAGLFPARSGAWPARSAR